ncbi:uncharacterized protein [Bos mutus]|uniref:uncharacterized protein n=1 Tax=Bos mutus TaxID=72004 RepID=UPI0038B4AE77
MARRGAEFWSPPFLASGSSALLSRPGEPCRPNRGAQRFAASRPAALGTRGAGHCPAPASAMISAKPLPAPPPPPQAAAAMFSFLIPGPATAAGLCAPLVCFKCPKLTGARGRNEAVSLAAAEASDGGGRRAPGCRGGGSAGSGGGGTLVAPVTSRVSLALLARTVVRAQGGCASVAPCVRHQPRSGFERAWIPPLAPAGCEAFCPRGALGLGFWSPQLSSQVARGPDADPGGHQAAWAWGPPAPARLREYPVRAAFGAGLGTRRAEESIQVCQSTWLPLQIPTLKDSGLICYRTPRPRSGVAAERSKPTSKERLLRGRRRTKRSYSTFKVRRAGCEEIPHVQGEKPPNHKEDNIDSGRE